MRDGLRRSWRRRGGRWTKPEGLASAAIRLSVSGAIYLVLSSSAGCAHDRVVRVMPPAPPTMPEPVLDELAGGACPATTEWVVEDVEGYFAGIRADRN